MLARLQLETRGHHPATDPDLERLRRDDVSSSQYRLYLMQIYGLQAPLESALATAPTLGLMIDLKRRARAGLIAQDLMQLGLRAQHVAELPLCLTIPQFRGAAEALGWLYVAERSTLAASALRAHLRTQLPHEMQIASAYLQAYAGVVDLRWRQLGTVLDQVARHPAIADRIVAAAREAFGTRQRWLAHEHAAAATRAVG